MEKDWTVVYTGNMSETIRISERVYLRKGNLPVRDQCNTGIVVGETGLLLVDLPEQFPEEKILDEAERYFGRKVKYLLFTHAHGDHRKGLATVKRKDLTLVSGRKAFLEIQECYPNFPAAQWTIPASGDELVLDGVSFRFWIPDKLPAHSPWDMCIALPDEKLVFTGDFAVPPIYMYNYSGNWKNWVKGLTDFQKQYEEWLLLMGHGDPAEGKKLLAMLSGYLSELGEYSENRTKEQSIPETLVRLSGEAAVRRQLREIYESQGKICNGKSVSIPRVSCPLCTQDDLEMAIRTVQMCRVDAPAYGFTRPFFGPGGKYGSCWWSLDAALIVDGYKWIEPDVEKEFLMNLIDTQETDGRVKLYGMDDFSHIPSVKVSVGSLPKFFETVYHILRRENNQELTLKGFSFLEKNLQWWFENRQDRDTGLFSAVFEETFLPNIEFEVMEYCPVDTNMQLLTGCICASKIAGWLGEADKEQCYQKKAEAIQYSINRWLWNEEKQAYYPWLPKEKKHFDVLMASALNVMRYNTADEGRIANLISKMTAAEYFGWGEHALCTVAKSEERFTVVEGTYIGNPCWSGSVWTLTNKAVIQALDSCGQQEPAAQLACMTIQEFAGDFTEFHHPFTGEGHGVRDYGWTAAQWIQILIEDIFGIDYDAVNGKITVSPNIPSEYRGEEFILENLCLPDGGKLDVHIKEGNVQYEKKD